jgi:hypothetical protein
MVAKPPPTPHPTGFLAEAVASLEEHFTMFHPPKVLPGKRIGSTKPSKAMVSADALRALVAEFDQQKIHLHDEDRRVAIEQRATLVRDLIDLHMSDETWADILRRAQAAAASGKNELTLLRFPCELCSDQGRAINVPEADWPKTLRGEAADIYRYWERDLKPKGFHLTAQVVDFPGGIPGDIGLTLVWGG